MKENMGHVKTRRRALLARSTHSMIYRITHLKFKTQILKTYTKFEHNIFFFPSGGGKQFQKTQVPETTAYLPLAPRCSRFHSFKLFLRERDPENLLKNLAPSCKVHYENVDTEKMLNMIF